ncbi:hypothetical protein IEN85_10630 [Pelagicoccus sp. NFK12]|uniref:Uncharacterized protein n=1 Tax=Pelagicoccus enzymogenes TaxID=2773457 RepID=A0A927FAL7_9BACT|nr:hypothetical protein [Pelagicoccus enzymogenes]MBD5779943.1 hypothetical protein [Pelagicoccus enzymogenes]
MKNNIKLLIAVAAIATLGLSVSNAQHHEHEWKAPNGGRIVTGIEPHAEVFVGDDGLVKVTFLSDEGAVLPPGKQLVTLVGGNRMDPIRLSFKKDGDSLVSEEKLPLDKPIPVVMQFQQDYGEKTHRERFQLSMSSCPSCEYKEYACACHGEEDSNGHGHEHGEHGHSH